MPWPPLSGRFGDSKLTNKEHVALRVLSKKLLGCVEASAICSFVSCSEHAVACLCKSALRCGDKAMQHLR